MLKHPVGLFRELQALEGLQVRPEEKTWLEKPRPERTSSPTVLYLGCNILRTPHLAQIVTDVFRRLGDPFVALGGPAFCCGVPYQKEEGTQVARRIGTRLADRLAQYRPRQVVVWCPGCFHFCKEVLSLSGLYDLVHVAEFLAENKHKLALAPQPPTRVALHYHCCSPDAERQAAAARTLLTAVPGLEVVEIGSDSAWGRSCSGNLRDSMGRQAWEASTRSYLEKAAAAGATIFATLYHGCHRMYAGHQAEFPFNIEHYLTVIGQALGFAYPDRYKEYLLWKDPSRILDDASSRLEANRVPYQRAIAAVDHVFVQGRGL